MRPNNASTTAPHNGVLSEYASRPEMARELNISQRTLARLDALRQGPPRLMLGGRCLYHIPSAREWLKSRLQSQVAAARRSA